MRIKGFTLIEMIIVLMISSIIIFLGFTISQNTKNEIQEEQYLQNLSAQINENIIEGRNRRQTVYFRFNADNVICYIGGKYKNYPYPKTLIHHGTERVNISNTGVSSPKTIIISRKNGRLKYHLIFELSFGGTFRVYKSN